MSNDNKVQLDVELDLGDGAVRDARRQFDELAKQYEEAFKNRRGQLAKGGRFSTGFLLSDEELKRATKNVEGARDHYLRLQGEYEAKSKPFLQRAGGLVHRMLFGDKVGSGEEADREQRQIANRIGFFHRQLHGTLALSSTLSRALAPLPGGGVLHAALAGAAGGFSQGMVNPNTGQARGGLLGLAGGLLGGVKGMAVNAGLSLLAKGVTGAVTGSQRDENLFFNLSQQAGGDTALGRGGVGLAYRSRLRTEEAAPLIGGAFRAGGGLGAAQGVLRAQLSAGLGGEYTQLLGGLARSGGGPSVDQNAKRLWTDVLATGVAQGLAKGRIGELIVGAMGIVGRQAVGVGVGDPSEIFRLSAFLGQNSKFQGSAGFSVMGKLDAFAKGESSPMARALALVNADVGQVGLAEAMRQTERGLFSGGANGDSIKRVRDMVKQVSGMVGGDRDQASMLLSNIGGFGINESTQLIDLVNSGKFGQKEYEALKTVTMTDEQKAFKAMEDAAGSWRGIEKQLQAIESVLGNIFRELGGFKAIQAVLEETLSLLRALNSFVVTLKRDGLAAALAGDRNKPSDIPGYKGTIDEAVGRDVTAKNAQLLANYQAQFSPELQQARTEAKKWTDPDAEEKLRLRQDKGGKFHFMFEMVDHTGRVVYSKEVQHRQQSASPSLGQKMDDAVWEAVSAPGPVVF